MWLEALKDTGELDDKYKMPSLPMDVAFSVAFKKPEGAQTQTEKLQFQERLIEMGLSSRTTAVMELFNMPREEAEEYLAKVDEDEAKGFVLAEQGELPIEQ